MSTPFDAAWDSSTVRLQVAGKPPKDEFDAAWDTASARLSSGDIDLAEPPPPPKPAPPIPLNALAKQVAAGPRAMLADVLAPPVANVPPAAVVAGLMQGPPPSAAAPRLADFLRPAPVRPMPQTFAPEATRVTLPPAPTVPAFTAPPQPTPREQTEQALAGAQKADVEAAQQEYDHIIDLAARAMPGGSTSLSRQMVRAAFAGGRGMTQAVTAGHAADLADLANRGLAGAIGVEPPPSVAEALAKLKPNLVERGAELAGFLYGVSGLFKAGSAALTAAGVPEATTMGGMAARTALEGLPYDIAFKAETPGQRALNIGAGLVLGGGLGALAGRGARAAAETPEARPRLPATEGPAPEAAAVPPAPVARPAAPQPVHEIDPDVLHRIMLGNVHGDPEAETLLRRLRLHQFSAEGIPEELLTSAREYREAPAPRAPAAPAPGAVPAPGELTFAERMRQESAAEPVIFEANTGENQFRLVARSPNGEPLGTLDYAVREGRPEVLNVEAPAEIAERLRARMELMHAPAAPARTDEEILNEAFPETPPAMRPRAPAVVGAPTKVLFPGTGEKLAAHYEWADLGDVVPSHSAQTFQPNPPEVYPVGIQGRAYHGERGQAAREGVHRVASLWDPEVALDMTVDAGGGRPVTVRTPEGRYVVVAGNNRRMSEELLSPERAAEWRAAQEEAAPRFGLGAPPAGMQRPSIVRVLEGVNPQDTEQLRQLNAASDVAKGKTKDLISDAATRAGQLRSADRALDHFSTTIGDEQTIREYLDGADGRQFMRELVNDGVIPETERPRFMDVRTGAPTEDGKSAIERMMRVAAVGDPDVVARAPAGVLKKLDSALPAIVNASRTEGWDLAPRLRAALDMLYSAQESGLPVRELAAQADLTGREWGPDAAEMARFLERTNKQGVTDAFRAYAAEAAAYRRQTATEDVFGFQPRGAGEAAGRFAAMRAAPQPPSQVAFARVFRAPPLTPGGRRMLTYFRNRLFASGGLAQKEEAARSIEEYYGANVYALHPSERALLEEARLLVNRGSKYGGEEVGGLTRRTLAEFDEFGQVEPDRETMDIFANQPKAAPEPAPPPVPGREQQELFAARALPREPARAPREPVEDFLDRAGGPPEGPPLTPPLRHVRSLPPPPPTAPAGEVVAEIKGMIREMGGVRARRGDIAAAQVADRRGAWEKIAGAATGGNAEARARFVQFTEAIEGGRIETLPAEDQPAARAIRKMLDERRRQVQALGTGKLQTFYENYFPHIWKQPDESIIGKIMGRRPLEGGKSFLKKRSIPTTAEGIAQGLEPADWNPINLALYRVREMDRYITAHQLLDEMKQKGLVRYVSAFEQTPEGHAFINDNIFTVYGSSQVPVKEAFDAKLMAQLDDFAQSLGIKETRATRPPAHMQGQQAKGTWGLTRTSEAEVPTSFGSITTRGGEVFTRFGGPETVRTHEIGHVLDHRFGLFAKIRQQGDALSQLRDLALMRAEGEQIPEKFREYLLQPGEQVANLIHAYVHARGLAEEVAPDAVAALRAIIKRHPELKPLDEIKPSLVLGEAEGTVGAGGLVTRGRYVATSPDVAHVINEYMKPSEFQGRGWFKAMRSINNALNQMQLLGMFHLGFVSFDAAISHNALALEYLRAGRPLKAAEHAALFTVAPIRQIIRGDRLMREWMRPGSTTPEYAQFIDALVKGGARAKMDAHFRSGALDAFRRALYTPGPARALQLVGLSVPAALEAAMVPVLEYVVPRMKLATAADLARFELERLGPEATQEQVRQAMWNAWRSVDNRLGQLVYDNLFWNRTAKDVAHLMVRSVGWNYGTLNELGGGVLDLRKLVGAGELTHRTAYAAALPLTVGAIGAVMTYLATGEGPKELKDYFYPPTGRRRPDGSLDRVTLPTYMKDVFAWGSHPATTALHKVSPFVSLLADLYKNEDFYGTEIRDKDANALEQAEDVGAYAARTLTPFSVRGTVQLRKSKESMPRSLAALFGVTPAPASMTRSDFENYIAEKYGETLPRGARKAEDVARSKRLGQAIYNIRSGEQPDLSQFTPRERKKIRQQARSSMDETRFSRLTLDQKLRAWEVASDQEREDNNLRRHILGGRLGERLANADPDERPDLERRLAAVRAWHPRGGRQLGPAPALAR